MKVEPLYSGFVPLASCHWQGLANLLESQGLARARQKVCLTWGFSWDGPGGPLGHSGRWLRLFDKVFDAAVAREEFDSWQQAEQRERALAAAGLPFVAEIDAWEVPSEHHLRRHVAHTVLVLERGANEVVVLDTMNLPEPRIYSLAQYSRMRTDPCVDRLHLYSSTRRPRRDPPPELVLAEAASDLHANRGDDMASLDGYIAWAEAEAEPLDVCRVGAERLQLAATFALLAERESALLEISRGLASLSKRWYLVHTLAEQQGGHEGRPRQLRLLAELREREMRLSERFETMTRQALTV